MAFIINRYGLKRIVKVAYCPLYEKNVHYTNSIKNKDQNSSESTQIAFRKKLLNGPNLKNFFENKIMRADWEDIKKNDHVPYIEPTLLLSNGRKDIVPYIEPSLLLGNGRKVYFEIYGCQMNVNDTEVIWSILENHDYKRTEDISDADVIFLVTCAIRESAEEKIWNKLKSLKGLRKNKLKSKPNLKIGVVGCMAERLKEIVLEKDQSIDLVVGPDAYRDIPKLLVLTESGQKCINVMLSYDETYADIMPVRLNEDSVSAYVSIMRGCDNMCTYCIVPWTRGKERSRPVSSILKEVESLVRKGVKEITLLGQNVNSYRDLSESYNGLSLIPQPTSLSKGFKTVYKPKLGGLRFSHLLEKVANIDPEVRIRFTSPHPKDFPDDCLHVIKSHPNICKSLHLPAQSGNSGVLERMRRGYTREAYLELVQHVREMLPSVAITSDFICGFCGETEEEFRDTLSLIEEVKYSAAYLFMYSMREKTAAHRRYKDDVPAHTKHKRLEEMIALYRYHVKKKNRAQVGQVQLVLIEGFSKRSNLNLVGRNDQNLNVIVPALDVVPTKYGDQDCRLLKPGDYVAVHINDTNSQILKGIPLYRTKLTDFTNSHIDSAGFRMRCLSLAG